MIYTSALHLHTRGRRPLRLLSGLHTPASARRVAAFCACIEPALI
jgi:hypothetical protein